MTHDEAMEGHDITHDEVLAELQAHGIMQHYLATFYAEMGKHETYNSRAVLEWLGY